MPTFLEGPSAVYGKLHFRIDWRMRDLDSSSSKISNIRVDLNLFFKINRSQVSRIEDFWEQVNKEGFQNQIKHLAFRGEHQRNHSFQDSHFNIKNSSENSKPRTKIILRNFPKDCVK